MLQQKPFTGYIAGFLLPTSGLLTDTVLYGSVCVPRLHGQRRGQLPGPAAESVHYVARAGRRRLRGGPARLQEGPCPPTGQFRASWSSGFLQSIVDLIRRTVS